MIEHIIDINCDLGEGIGNDPLIMPFISSCSIACGGHFGNEDTIRTAIQLAKKHRVKVGAHPSFLDQENFGRKILKLKNNELSEDIFQQILFFQSICETEDIKINHIKLHGALYNLAAKDVPTADAVLEGIIQTNIQSELYVPYNSVLAKKAEKYFPLVYEAFIDRGYNNDLSLVPRNQRRALITSPEIAWQQFYNMVTKSELTTISNKKRTIIASTFCIHGDNLSSVKILHYIHSKMEIQSISLV